MEKLLEFDCIVYLSKPSEDRQAEKYRDLGINMPEEDEQEGEKIVKYAFDASKVIEVRETFAYYKSEWIPATGVVYMVGDIVADTPPLLIAYKDFKNILNEHIQKSLKTK